ncbi:hypothetical protein FRC11_005189 [Ceratobasidium sp. 423]|nr:hypothetical protein FRC11_005189 [Ceratobasidium sp. 423]
MTPDGHPDLSYRHSDLGKFYDERFRRWDDLEDLKTAIECRSRALALTPDGHPKLPHRHAFLGTSFALRFHRLGELNDVEKAIEHLSRALALAPDGDPNLPLYYANLGVTFIFRFEHLGEFNDLDKAIGHQSHALALAPNGDPGLPRCHTGLATCYSRRFQRLGKSNDLVKSFDHAYRALVLTPDGHPDLPLRYAHLGTSHTHRFWLLGELNDLKKAIEYEFRALALTPDDHPHLPSRHADLGVSYINRFRRLGELNDLEKAIEHSLHALALTLDGDPELPRWQAHLGVSYSDRFRHLGELNDLEKAIEHKSCALALTPDNHVELPNRHTSLGVSYSDRFKHLGESKDLVKAIEHKSHALALTPDGHPDLSIRHANLGGAYGDRFWHLGELNDLEKAIEHNSHALALTPDGHPDLPSRHAGLGVSYTQRFQRLGGLNDLEKAIDHNDRAIALTPDRHPLLPDRYFHQALSYFDQYQLTGDPSHMKRALNSFRRASELSSGAPREVFRNALEWAKLAAKHSILNCIEAYSVTMSLLPHFIWLGSSTAQRYRDLSTAENLALQAASAAILHSDPKLALEWLEQARCVVWNQSLMLRSPLDHLHLSYPDLASRLHSLSRQLHAASFETPASQSLVSGSVDLEHAGRHRRSLAKDYSDLLTQVRRLPGFEDFLQPMKTNTLVHVARYGPIVVIICHNERCDALLVLPHQSDISHLSLPDFTEEKARNARSDIEASLRKHRLRERGFRVKQDPEDKDRFGNVLAVLWTSIVKPVLDHLGYTNNNPPDNLPHITWCPTGVMSFLPLHAAGDYSQPQTRLFDYAISSYTPTLAALLVSTPSSLNHRARVLAIGQANTPHHNPLPGISKELACLKAHTQNIAEYSQLIDGQATTAAVLEAMEQHDWVHLACHAHQNISDPTKSGFFLHDGTLDLVAINQRSFKNKGLAFLSACQTATGDERLPDEAIHLASGMLMAGYPSVIATMWSVKDDDAPFVADKVYGQLMKDGKVGNGEAGKALHYAVAELREKVGEGEFGRWVPYIHLGS